MTIPKLRLRTRRRPLLPNSRITFITNQKQHLGLQEPEIKDNWLGEYHVDDLDLVVSNFVCSLACLHVEQHVDPGAKARVPGTSIVRCLFVSRTDP